MQSYEWVVVGAGPAGIAAVGKLIDFGVQPKRIGWIDPAFQVGDFGSKWQHVSSNTKVGLFLRFFEACQAFNYHLAPPFAIQRQPAEETCMLALAADPLQWISNQLQAQVNTIYGWVEALHPHDSKWQLKVADKTIAATNVILAIGSEPKQLAYPLPAIHLTIALHPAALKAACTPQDVIAVFGSSHSAVLILKTLLEECNIQRVINFYLSPLRYAVYFDDWILYDDTGLKGIAAQWAKANLEGNTLPSRLARYHATPENIATHLPQCTKAIYATGFQARTIANLPTHYNNQTGEIAPHLFGIGIAFPEAKVNPEGMLEYRVGLWKFMDYLERVVPLWVRE